MLTHARAKISGWYKVQRGNFKWMDHYVTHMSSLIKKSNLLRGTDLLCYRLRIAREKENI